MSSSPLFLVDPHKELFRWGPVPGRLFFMSEFNRACFITYPARFEYGVWPDTALLFFEDRMLWLNQSGVIEEMGKEIFVKDILSRERRQKLYRMYKDAVARLRAFQDGISLAHLASLSQEDFLQIWKQFYELLSDFWIPTIPPEIGNYGSGALLEAALREAVSANDISHVMEILTAPEELSFYQEEEIALAETSDLEAHAAKYHWLKNSYGYCERLPVSFFAERKKNLSSDVREKMEAHIREAKEKKAEIVARYHLPEATLAIAEGLHDAMVWQDERKREIVESIAYKNVFLEEVARRTGVPVADLYFATCEEIPSFISSGDFSILSKRKEGCMVELGEHNGDQIISITDHVHDEMQKLWNMYLEEKVTDATEFKGIIACKGNGVVRGKVKILLRPENLEEFEGGSVLVAPMTSPEYVFAMKRASAILTDTGGLTSHAAIVSRELKIPCLVGTKIATKVLKDGDEVEVDAEKGIVRKTN